MPQHIEAPAVQPLAELDNDPTYQEALATIDDHQVLQRLGEWAMAHPQTDDQKAHRRAEYSWNSKEAQKHKAA